MHSTIRPGFLVSIRTRLVGGCTYERCDKGTEINGNSETSSWETTKNVIDVNEHKQASDLRISASKKIKDECVNTSFGYVCLEKNESNLQAAIKDAQKICRDFNEKSQYTKVTVNAVVGKIASQDREAMQIITNDLRDIFTEIKSGVATGNVELIRKNITRAREAAKMLDESTSEKVTAAIKSARELAKKIVRVVEGEGQTVEEIVKEFDSSTIDNARFAFIDESSPTEPAVAEEINTDRFALIE